MNGNPNPANNESAVYNMTIELANSLPRYDFIPIVLQTISRARPGWFLAASAVPQSYFINLRGSPFETNLPPNNTIWNVFNEFSVWYIKGYIAASMNASNNLFVVVIAENFTSTYVNNANAYLAGLRSVNENSILYVIDTAGNFGNEQIVMNRIKSIESANNIYFPIIAHMQSQQNWPNITRNESRLLIENQLDVDNFPNTRNNLIGPSQPHVLVTTEWNHNALNRELIQKGIDRGFDVRETSYLSKNQEDELIINISQMADIVPQEVKRGAKELRNKFIKKDHKHNILCDEFVVSQLRDAYLVINDCIQTDAIVYRTKLSEKIVHLSVFA